MQNRIISLDSVSNIDYLYIGKEIIDKSNQNNLIQPGTKPVTPPCYGKYEYCKDCIETDVTGCVIIEQDVTNDINKMANIIAARLRNEPAIEDEVVCKSKYDFWEKEYASK